jgi:diguanylate cyclase (GGDEF)-like protein
MAIKLNLKRVFLFGFVSLIPLLLMLILIHERIGTSLKETAFSHLEQIHQSKKTSLIRWLEQLEVQMDAIAIEIGQETTLPASELTPETLKKIILKHKNFISYYLSTKDLKTILFIDLKGNLLYRGGKPVSLRPTQKFSEHCLSVSDFYLHDHLDSKDGPYITHVIYSADHEPVMILIGFIDTTKIDEIMQIDNQYWKSNESYLVDEKMQLRSTLRLEPSTKKVNTISTQKALEGLSGQELIPDYHEKLVYSVFSPFVYDSIHWAMVSEVDFQEVSAPLRALEKYIVIIFIGLAIFSFLIIFLIIFYQRKYEEKLKYQANYDTLTHLPNRMMLNSHLSYLVDHYQHGENNKLAIMFLDVDHFKEINDSYGHSCGDFLLVQVTQRIQKSLRSSDFIARMSGDEFIIILERYEDIDDLYMIADKLINSMSAPFDDAKKERQFSISVSIGIAIFEEGQTKEKLMRNADVAMYEAKNKGRNRFVLYEKHMAEDLKHYLEMKSHIITAIEKESFYMLYQPKYDTESTQIIGFEILLRMKDTEGETILPDEFIKTAEKSGQIIEIDKWMIRHAIEQISQLKDLPIPRFSVNISAKSISDNTFIDTLFSALGTYNVEGSLLEVELTENIMLQYDENLQAVLEKLHDYGIKLSIDNFGSGYSSLHHLQSLPVRALKIDRSVINNITSIESDRNIVEAIIALGHTYHYKVIAEGVETKEQLHILKKLKCDAIQGYLYSKPISFDEIRIFCNSNKSTLF